MWSITDADSMPRTSPGRSKGIAWSGRMPGFVSRASTSVALRGRGKHTNAVSARGTGPVLVLRAWCRCADL